MSLCDAFAKSRGRGGLAQGLGGGGKGGGVRVKKQQPDGMSHRG